MYLDELYKIKEGLLEELSQYSRGRITDKNLCEIDTLAHATKNICKVIHELEEEEYDNNYSMKRGTSRAPHGRFSYRNNNSRRNRASYHSSDDMVEELTDLMEDAQDEATRQEFQKLINKLEAM